MKSQRFWIILYILTYCIVVQCYPQTVHAQIRNISKAISEADLILIGKLPVEQKEILDHTGIGPAILVGYEIESLKFLKGAAPNWYYPSDPSWHSRSVPSWNSRTIYLHVPSPPDTVPFDLPHVNKTPKNYIYFFTTGRACIVTNWLKPIGPNSWFLPATENNIMAVESQLTRPKEWGLASQGLRLGLRPIKPSFRQGDIITIEVYIQNVSDSSILVPQHRIRHDDSYPFTRFAGGTGIKRVGKSAYSYTRGRLIVIFEKPPSIGRRLLYRQDFLPPVKLAPREIYRDTVRLDSWQWNTSDGLSPYRPGNTLLLRVCFNTYELKNLKHINLTLKEQFWKGNIESTYVSIRFEDDANQPHEVTR
jgi:hypothetical protein